MLKHLVSNPKGPLRADKQSSLQAVVSIHSQIYYAPAIPQLNYNMTGKQPLQMQAWNTGKWLKVEWKSSHCDDTILWGRRRNQLDTNVFSLLVASKSQRKQLIYSFRENV